MAEWPGLIRRLEDLLTNVTSANSTAHDAIARGEDTLKKAKDMLDRLRVTIVFFALLGFFYVRQEFIIRGKDWYIEDITWPCGDTKFLFEC